MTAIINFIRSFARAVGTFFDLILGFFQDIVYLIKMTGIFLSKIPTYFGWLPDHLVSLLFIGFSIVVIYKILGREG